MLFKTPTRLLAVLTSLLLAISGCTSTALVKRSDHSEIYSPAMGRYMSYSVYTPPDWTPDESLPLMVLLHGGGDSHESFDRYAVGLKLDEEINAGRAPRMIIVSPDGELGFWENWHDGSKLYRDWVVKDLVPYVANRYATKSCPKHCYLSGISMGGHGAMRFAYYEQNTFNSVAVISAPIISKLHPGEASIGRTLMKWLLPTERIWGDIDSETSDVPKDLDPYVSWVNRKDLLELPLLLVWGTEDSQSILSANQHFQQHLNAYDKQHKSLVYDGKHKWIYWREIMPDVLAFHASAGAQTQTNE